MVSKYGLFGCCGSGYQGDEGGGDDGYDDVVCGSVGVGMGDGVVASVSVFDFADLGVWKLEVGVVVDVVEGDAVFVVIDEVAVEGGGVVAEEGDGGVWVEVVGLVAGGGFLFGEGGTNLLGAGGGG